MFVTIEDEDGDMQLILWPHVFARGRRALGSRIILVHGTVSRYDGTTNAATARIEAVRKHIPLPTFGAKWQ